MTAFNENYKENLEKVKTALRVGESFDIIIKKIKIADKQATLFCIDGFVKDEMLEKELEYLTKLTNDELKNTPDADSFLDSYITYIEASAEKDLEKFITFILSGAVGMIVEGFSKAIIIFPIQGTVITLTPLISSYFTVSKSSNLLLSPLVEYSFIPSFSFISIILCVMVS